MPVIDVTKDLDNLTFTITAEFAAPIERVWQIYADPRQLEQVWGPPACPATFVDHSLLPGARVTYFMTGPGGEKYAGWWRISSVNAPYQFAFEDGFADADFNPLDKMPVSQNVYTFEAIGAGTRAIYQATFATAEALRQVLEMGIEEGATAAIGQIDGFLTRH